jgi:hypothetical protein
MSIRLQVRLDNKSGISDIDRNNGDGHSATMVIVTISVQHQQSPPSHAAGRIQLSRRTHLFGRSLAMQG